VYSRAVIIRLVLGLAFIAIVLTVGLGFLALGVWQYLQAPLPTVEVHASYPGANAQVVADTVAAPIEQQVNGVEDMVGMSRECGDDGHYRLTITFRRGTNVDIAQVLVQNRVTLAMPVIPELVNRAGISVIKPVAR
jgi:multidrug efflux pump